MTRPANQSPLASHQSAPAASHSSGSGGNFHNVISDPCAINAKGRDPFRDDLTDQPRLVLVGVTIPGLGGRGVASLPFIYQPFHAQEIDRA